MRFRQYVILLIDQQAQLGQRHLPKGQVDLEAKLRGVVYLTASRLNQAVGPAVLIVMLGKLNLLDLELPAQDRLVSDLQLITDALRQKSRQASINNPLLLRAVAIPMNNLVGESLATTTHRVAYACRTDTNTGGFNGWIKHKTLNY